MDDLVSREAVKKWLELWDGYIDMDIVRRMQYRVIDIPSTQLERKKGSWIKEHWHSDHVRQCSACHVTQTVTTYMGIVNFKFCPYCGADMRGESDV